MAARAALPAETLVRSAVAVGRHLADLLTDTPSIHRSGAGRTIAAYVPFGREPGGDLPAFLADLLPAATILLPVMLPDRDLDWAPFRPGELPEDPSRGIAQRLPASIAAGGVGVGARVSAVREPTGPRLGTDAIERADLIIVPALAVDRRGHRLGRGGGSYDRALARVGPDTLTVALLHDGELLEELPAEAHDRPVQLVITPLGRYRTAT